MRKSAAVRKYDLLICGLGSIGIRHLDIALSLGFEKILVVSDRCDVTRVEVDQISRQALSQTKVIAEYGIISSVISAHLSDILLIKPLCNRIFVEKPLVCPSDLGSLIEMSLDNMLVGYCMRFHPVTKKLRQLIKRKRNSARVISIDFSNCSDLRNWRDSDEGRLSSSISTEAGGNIYRELSHDFDLAQYLLEGCDWSDYRVEAVHSHSLGAPAVVLANIGARLQDVDVTFELSLVSTSACKKARLLFDDGVIIHGDFLSGLVNIESPRSTEVVFTTKPTERVLPEMYEDQLKAFFNSSEHTDVRPCSWQEAIEIIKFISELESL